MIEVSDACHPAFSTRSVEEKSDNCLGGSNVSRWVKKSCSEINPNMTFFCACSVDWTILGLLLIRTSTMSIRTARLHGFYWCKNEENWRWWSRNVHQIYDICPKISHSRKKIFMFAAVYGLKQYDNQYIQNIFRSTQKWSWLGRFRFFRNKMLLWLFHRLCKDRKRFHTPYTLRNSKLCRNNLYYFEIIIELRQLLALHAFYEMHIVTNNDYAR